MKDFNKINEMRFEVYCIIEKSNFMELLGFPRSNVESKEDFNNGLYNYIININNAMQELEELKVLLEDCYILGD